MAEERIERETREPRTNSFARIQSFADHEGLRIDRGQGSEKNRDELETEGRKVGQVKGGKIGKKTRGKVERGGLEEGNGSA